MIVKLTEKLDWTEYKMHSRVVKAMRIREDFLYETPHGWVEGFKGQWLVELGERLRCNLDHEFFIKYYRRRNKRGLP